MNVENKRDDRKKKIREIAGGILCIAVLLFIVMQIMLPETGIGGMVNEGSMAVLFFGVGAVCAYAAIKKRKEDKSALVLGLCLAVLACVPVFSRCGMKKISLPYQETIFREVL